MADQETGPWRKLSAVSGFTASLIIPVVLAIVGNQYAQAIKEREIQGRYVELAISILKERPDDSNRNVRAWAVKIIDRYSGVPLDAAARQEIEAAPLLAAEPIVLFDNTNKEGVLNHPPRPAVFTLSDGYFITHLKTYHWNEGRGAAPGKIALKHENGTVFGPWEVSASAGHGGAPNVNWFAHPNTAIPAGKYTVIDSEPQTWSYNDRSNGMGFVYMKGHPLR